MNRTKLSVERQPNPVLKASYLSKLTFWWLRDLFRKGLRRPIKEEEIYENKPNLDSNRLTEKLAALWDEELKKPNPSVLKVLFRAYGPIVVVLGLIYSMIETITRVAQPLCLGGLVTYFAINNEKSPNPITKSDAYMYAGGIVICSLIPVLTFHPFILYIFQVGLKMRLACSGLIYKKALRISKTATNDGLSGRAINILSNDLAKFDIAMCFLHDLWKGPSEAILLGYFMYLEIGISAVIGVAFMLSFIPLQAWGAKKAAQYRQRTAERTDLRVKFMNEIIQGIQVIKMYAWEQSFASVIDKVRRKEINAIRGTVHVHAALYSTTMISKFSIFLSLVSYVYLGDAITARKVFTVSSFFNVLNDSMVHFWPMAITFCAEAYISTRRVKEFLLVSEGKGDIAPINMGSLEKLDPKDELKIRLDIVSDEKPSFYPKRKVNLDTDKKAVIMENATAVWDLTEIRRSGGIDNISLEILGPKLCAIVGPVGSGKSTLLNVIMGELELDKGCITINGSIGYASQESWLFEGTIRDNIIFVENYDEERYWNVVKVCALERDFELLPHGDFTIVGERGISLSGGQKARVNLARAIYKNADIYLLDDPLSAVDTQVAKHIFEKCLKEFLSQKICVLVTHQLQYLKDVEHLIVMDSGEIKAQGSYHKLQEMEELTFLSATHDESGNPVEKVDKEFQKLTEPKPKEKSEDLNEDRKEYQAIGSVSLAIYKSYFKSLSSPLVFIGIILLFLAARAMLTGVDYFISRWVIWEETLPINTLLPDILDKNTTTTTTTTTTDAFDNVTTTAESTIDKDREQFILIYSLILGIAFVLFLSRTFGFFIMCLRISLRLHDKLFRGVTRATMYFFNTNPSGRILNRFSKDIHTIDTTLPGAMIDCISFFMDITAVLTIVAVANYWLLIPALVVSILFYVIRTAYINTARSIKRIESMTRSPVYSHANQTFQGLTTIRAFNAQKILEQEFHEHQNLNTSSWYLFLTTTRAFALWLDVVCVVYIGVVTFSFLLIENQSFSGDVGLAILQCVNMVGMCQWGMRQTAELENQMTSVERVVEYAEQTSEPPLESLPKYRPPNDWPDQGKIQFSNVRLRYSQNSGHVLKDLNFAIEAKEKIGIVGRTGAGKSSIIQAIFRLAVNEGSIYIDGIDISTLGLHDLRSKISIIPQDPVLFSGTLRYNLDPFEQKSDSEIWNSLEQVELKSFVSSFAGGLNHKMSDGGSNFSMGQRQLVCLARAILRSNKVLILDEATANVDPETDKLIQTTIRTKFADCTVLTIAHRLHTVMDSDRVLVIEAGCAVEFAHPYELLQRSGGFLRKLVDQTGHATANILLQTAESNYKDK